MKWMNENDWNWERRTEAWRGNDPRFQAAMEEATRRDKATGEVVAKAAKAGAGNGATMTAAAVAGHGAAAGDDDVVEVVVPRRLRKRVRKRAASKIRDRKTTPRTKEKAAKLHRSLARGDESLGMLLDDMEEEDDKFGSQEAMNVAFDYMEHNE